MRRRTVLALALVTLLAGLSGCSAAGSLSLTPVDDRALAEEASHPAPTDAPPDDDERVVQRAIENGTATAVGDHPPVDERLPFRHDGRFYAVEHAENGTASGYDVGIRIDFNASSVDGTVVDYEELPAVDRETLEFVLSQGPPDEDGLEPGYDFGVGATYTESDAESSVLVPTQEYDAVRYEGEAYPIDVEAERTELTVYRYEASEVAESHEAYAESLRDRYEFELSGLSDTERTVVEDALNGTNYIEDSDNEAFDSLVDRFRAQEAVEETDYRGSYVVRYDGRLYWAEMDYGSYVTDAEPSPPEETPPPEP
ncbi:hypothetical protein [Halosimplex pelagicum]|uniref:Uncharacterized protein n=1 Tax=Halosimplex pelagicum TaxID=869886 RepID=A0A7D5P960_9EURY|nr:hypothetical protein [Halosimplex pelagicum]QLH83917.1 hypothetical protein HZS54_20780 [Halosimplex pelagicum]